ncbi:MAG: carbon-nitrogen family hydrolase [Bacillota bacterium]|nr:carbon-nitrogen family hydrolase [Bacillota bacterium]
MKLKVSVIQSDIIAGDIGVNEVKAEIAIKKCAAAGADVVVLSELWNCGYDLKNLPAIAQKEKDSSMSLLKALAEEYGINIVGGSIAERQDGAYYNMLPLINRRGKITEKYRKAHLFSLGLEEEKYFNSGDQWGLGEIDGIVVGLMLCYDLRFPEFCRNLALRGAKIVFVPAQWPLERIAQWRILLQSRAVENQVFVVGVNRVGKSELSLYSGHSLIIDPYGNILAEGSEEEEILSGVLDMELIDICRTKIPSLNDRLNILDEIDNNYF